MVRHFHHSFSFSEISNTQRCCHFAHRLLHREVISPQRLYVFSDYRPAKCTEFLNFLSFLCRYWPPFRTRKETEKDFPKIKLVRLEFPSYCCWNLFSIGPHWNHLHRLWQVFRSRFFREGRGVQTRKNRRRYVHNILFEHSTVTQKVKLRFAETDQDMSMRKSSVIRS